MTAENMKNSLKAVQILGWAFLASVLFQGAAVYLASLNSKFMSGDPNANAGIVKMFLLFVSIFNLTLAGVVKRPMIKNLNKGIAEKTLTEEKIFRLFFILTFIPLLLSEIPSIFGVIVFFLSKKISDYSLFAFISLIALAVNFPRLTSLSSSKR